MNTKILYINVMGLPNSGKSTLTNTIVGEKVSIITPKPQTTRQLISGIITIENTQLILLDTPGILQHKNHQLEKPMNAAIATSKNSADIHLVMIDANKPQLDQIIPIIQQLPKANTAIALNKIDKTNKADLLELTQNITKQTDIENIFMISALKKDGIEGLEKFFLREAKPSDFHYDPDDLSDLNMKQIAAEITRESLLFALDKEIPHQLAVITEKFEETKKSYKLNQIIYVPTESHKRIIIGHQGQNIRHIGEKSRKQLSYLWEKPVSLFLFVKVKDNWYNDMSIMGEMGL